MCCVHVCYNTGILCKVTFIKYLHFYENLQTVCYRKQDVLIKLDFFVSLTVICIKNWLRLSVHCVLFVTHC